VERWIGWSVVVERVGSGCWMGTDEVKKVALYRSFERPEEGSAADARPWLGAS
jgi:hypothetical protein